MGYSPWGCKRDRIEQLNNNNPTIYGSPYPSIICLSFRPSSICLFSLSFHHLSICPSIYLSYLSTFYLPILSFYLPIYPPSWFCFSGEP